MWRTHLYLVLLACIDVKGSAVASMLLVLPPVQKVLHGAVRPANDIRTKASFPSQTVKCTNGQSSHLFEGAG
eukprot:scaffold122886_cov31-Prasinocladus_malaysianus.AAC.1